MDTVANAVQSADQANGLYAKTREVAPFLKNLRKMLEEESEDVLRWTADGCAFEIHDMERMMAQVLPKYFKHRKYTSFQRQLNYFNFRKWTKSKAVVCTFSNEYFLRDHPELAWRITRKKSVHQTPSKAAAARKAAALHYRNGTWKRDGCAMLPQFLSRYNGDAYASPTQVEVSLFDSDVASNANAPTSRYYSSSSQGYSGRTVDPLDLFDEFMPANDCKVEHEPIGSHLVCTPPMLRSQYPSPSYSVLPAPNDFGSLCSNF